MKNNIQHSFYWLDNKTTEKFQQLDKYFNIDDSDCGLSNIKLENILKLSDIYQIIKNFVNIILDNEHSIEIKFSSEQSFALENKITISADISDVDSLVGLSLHEASHIKYSKKIFKILKTLNDYFTYYKLFNLNKNKILVDFVDYIEKKYNELRELDSSSQCRIKFKKLTYSLFRYCINIFEDYRVNTLIQNKFSGYKKYYDHLYDKYMNKDVRSFVIKDNYGPASYLINIMYFTFDRDNCLHELKYGNEIIDIIKNDIKNVKSISSLSVNDILLVAFKIFKILLDIFIENNIIIQEFDSSNINYQLINNNTSDDLKINGEVNIDNKSRKFEFDAFVNNYFKSVENNDDQEAIEILKSINGEYNKIAPDVNSDLLLKLYLNNHIEIKFDKYKAIWNDTTYKVPIIFIKKNLDLNLMKELNSLYKVDNQFVHRLFFELPSSLNSSTSDKYTLYKSELCNAIARGYKIGNKIKLLNDSHKIENTRKKHGSDIDYRLLSETAAGNYNIFKKIVTINNQPDKFIHISIDGSMSMLGSKGVNSHNSPFFNSLKMAATIIAAASCLRGARVQVSLRSTLDIKNYKTDTNGNTRIAGFADVPYIAIIYDSNYDTVEKIKTIWPLLQPSGNTPESLCFNAIKDYIFECAQGRDSYFINISDGEPYFGNGKFAGDIAAEHGRNIIKHIKQAGIKVLSYFITYCADYNYRRGFINMSGSYYIFEKIYGKDSSFAINFNETNQIINTLNRCFLK